MQRAGLISGVTETPTYHEASPVHAFGSYYRVLYWDRHVYQLYTVTTGRALAAQAAMLDSKIDDCKPLSGKVRLDGTITPDCLDTNGTAYTNDGKQHCVVYVDADGLN